MDVSRRIAAPPERVWTILAQTEHWPGWGPSVLAVEPEATLVTAGLRGRVRSAAGVWLPFEITDVDPGRSWHWRVAGVHATGHRVEPDGENSVAIFEVPAWAAPYGLVCRIALQRIERLATD